MTIKELKDQVDYVVRNTDPDSVVKIGIPDSVLNIEIDNIAVVNSLNGGACVAIVLRANRNDSTVH